MTDTIVQEVREARAQIAEEFRWDRARFWSWVRSQHEAERKAKHKLPIILDPAREAIGGTASPRVPRKRPARSPVVIA